MKKKKSKKPRISKRQQAENKRNGLWTVSSDGSYFDQTDQAGGAMVIADSDGKKPRIICWSLNGDYFGVTESGQAELWAAALSIKYASAGKIGTLATDCPFVPSRIADIRAGTLNKKRYNGDLFDILEEAVLQNPQMHVVRVLRSQSRIPIANGFAQAAAHEDADAMQKQARRFSVEYEWLTHE